MNVEVNYLAVVLAAVASMVVGFVWYSPALFAKQWMKLTGNDMKPGNNAEMAKTYGLTFVLALITAYVLFHISALSMNFFHYSNLTTGLTSAFWVWLGFIMPVQLGDVLFNKQKIQLFGINTGYRLVSLLVMGAVIGLLR